MRQKFGETRSSIRDRHALISPDSHERTIQVPWPDSLLIFVITPQMGAEFTQYFAEMSDGATGGPPLPGVERFVFVLSGRATLSIGADAHELGEEGKAVVAYLRKEPEGVKVVGVDREWPGKLLADAGLDVDTGLARYGDL